MKRQEHIEAIKLIQTSELRKEPFPSIDGDSKLIVQSARNLTNLFCCGDLLASNTTSTAGQETKVVHVLASKAHTEAIADFVNRELLAHQRTLQSDIKAEKLQISKNSTNKEESDEIESFGTKRNFKSD